MPQQRFATPFISPRARLAAQSGFSLLEVLVSILVLAIGVLGAALLQLNALRYSTGAAHATQASFIAYDMLDRLRANVDQLDSYAGLQVQGCAGPATGASILAQDLADFATAVGCELPAGQGSIEISGNRATVSVQWDESRVQADQPHTLFVVSSLVGPDS